MRHVAAKVLCGLQAYHMTPCDEGAYSSAAEQLAGWTHSVIEYAVVTNG
jgi:hypothetical protein